MRLGAKDVLQMGKLRPGDPSDSPTVGSKKCWFQAQPPGFPGLSLALNSLDWDSLVAQMVSNLPAVLETGFDPWARKMLWRKAWQSTPVFLPGKSPWTEEPGELQSTGSQNWT